MRVTLSSNIPNRRSAALALVRAGYLEKYICAALPGDEHWIYGLAPDGVAKKLRARTTKGLDLERVVPLWLPEILQKGLPRLGLVSRERGNWINNHLYDLMAARHATNCEIFHFTSSVGLYSARRAKSNGALIVCDQRAAHPDAERAELRPEYDLLGLAFEPPGLLYDGKVKQEYELADYLITGSSFARRTFVERGYDQDRIFSVPYGAVSPEVDDKLPDDEGTFRVVFAGQIVPRKGVHYLVRAFEELALPRSELVLAGRVSAEMRPVVEGWVRRGSDIVVTGSLPGAELQRQYRRGSVFVLPSVSDSWGLVVGEAMAAGLPVIVTENTGSSEMVREGKDGFVVPVRDVESLKRAMLRLYGNKKLCREMGAAARERVKEFSWERYGERLISVYQEIARREGIGV